MLDTIANSCASIVTSRGVPQWRELTPHNVCCQGTRSSWSAKDLPAITKFGLFEYGENYLATIKHDQIDSAHFIES